MIESRRWPRARPAAASTQRPASSGPRWSSVPAIASTMAALPASRGVKKTADPAHRRFSSRPRHERAEQPPAPSPCTIAEHDALVLRDCALDREEAGARNDVAAGGAQSRVADRRREGRVVAEAAPAGRSGRPRGSRRALGQSVLTTGQPHAIAWISTPGSPSLIEDKAKTAARAM